MPNQICKFCGHYEPCENEQHGTCLYGKFYWKNFSSPVYGTFEVEEKFGCIYFEKREGD